jgi:hypothetical protein
MRSVVSASQYFTLDISAMDLFFTVRENHGVACGVRLPNNPLAKTRCARIAVPS